MSAETLIQSVIVRVDMALVAAWHILIFALPVAAVRRGRRAGWVLTGQVVLPHSVRLPERPAVPSAAFTTAAGPSPPPLLHHLPAPPTCRLGRHGSDPPATATSPSFPVRRGRAALCHVSSQGFAARDATRKAAWYL